MNQQNKLQKILKEILKEKGYDTGTMHIYCTIYGTKAKNQQAKSQGWSNAVPSLTAEIDEDDMDLRLQLNATITEDKADFTVEAPAVRAEPGKLSGKYMKHTTALDKFGFGIMQVLNASDEE